MTRTKKPTALLLKVISCFKGGVNEGNIDQAAGDATVQEAAADYPLQVAKKATAAGSQQQPAGSACGTAAGSADETSNCSAIPALYELPKRSSAGVGADMLSYDAPSTSYPTTSLEDEWDVLGACMTTAQEMEACVDAVLEGSVKSAQTLFARYDMDLDQRLRQQDFYDLMLELALALPYQEYQRFVEASFTCADRDHDGFLTLQDFVPLYKSIAAVRRAFRHQDHHNNGQIDRYDFYQLLMELELDVAQGGQQQLQAFADAAFSLADTTGRGIVNFGQVLVWHALHQLANSKQRSSVTQVSEQQRQ